MAVIISQQQKRQKYLVIVFLVVLAVTGVVVWWGFLRKSSPSKATAISVPPPRPIKINFDLFESQAFKNLQSEKKILPYSGRSGVVNPFLPY